MTIGRLKIEYFNKEDRYKFFGLFHPYRYFSWLIQQKTGSWMRHYII